MAIGLAYGVRNISVPFRSNFSIALFSGIATLISSLIGNLLTNCIPAHLGNIIGGAIVGFIGIYTIVEHLHNRKKSVESHKNSIQCFDNLKAVMDNPSIADKDYSGDISLKESISLGIALAANCLGTGFGAGITGINIYALSSFVVVFSLITILLGAFVGRHFATKFSSDKATLISGLLLLAVGLYQVFI